MKGFIKSITTDKYLLPIRHQICGLVKQNSSVIEFGCGNGDLLFKLSNKISYGLGIDNSKNLIKYAIQKSKALEKNNLSFKVFNINNPIEFSSTYNYAVVSLLLHLLPWKSSIKLLQTMFTVTDNIIICSFVKPNTKKEKILLHVDQFFSNQYSNFNYFINNNGVKGLLEELNIPKSNIISFNTFDNSIKVYNIKTKK